MKTWKSWRKKGIDLEWMRFANSGTKQTSTNNSTDTRTSSHSLHYHTLRIRNWNFSFDGNGKTENIHSLIRSHRKVSLKIKWNLTSTKTMTKPERKAREIVKKTWKNCAIIEDRAEKMNFKDFNCCTKLFLIRKTTEHCSSWLKTIQLHIATKKYRIYIETIQASKKPRFDCFHLS